MSRESDITKKDLIKWLEGFIVKLKKSNIDSPQFDWEENNEYQLQSGHFRQDFTIRASLVNKKKGKNVSQPTKDEPQQSKEEA